MATLTDRMAAHGGNHARLVSDSRPFDGTVSGIVGVLRFDGRPPGDVIDRMLLAVRHRGLDGESLWRSEAVALGHARLCTTPESRHERQPLRDDAGDLCLVFDGRVDNRRDLRGLLTARGFQVRDDTDPELVLCAYACWGTACADQIIGDFAFAVWDASRRRLFCARDPLGIKSLFYHWDRRAFRLASELRALLADPDVPRAPNEGLIGEFLAGELCQNVETFFDGLKRLPAGHTLSVEAGQLRCSSYWDPASLPMLRYGNDQDYAAHFLEVFTDAVRCRMRSDTSVAAALSGGFDSSAVVCTATSLWPSGVGAGALETFSLTFPGLSCDERAYITAVAEACHTPSHELPIDAETLAPDMAYAALGTDWPMFPNDVMFDRLRHAVQCRGLRVLLTGEGGDQVFSGLYHPYTQLIAASRWSDVLRQVQLDVARFGVAALPSHVYWHALRPFIRRLVPARAARAARRWLPHRPLPPWIGGPFAQRTGLRDRLRHPDLRSASSSAWQALVHRRLLSGWQAFYNDVADQAAARFGFEYRHPFCDRRVVEFSMVLPLDQYWRTDDRKIVAPLALRGVIPDCIRCRTTKAEFSELLVEGWATAGDRLFGDLRIGQLGWVDSARLRRLFDHTIDLYARGDGKYAGFANTLWPALAVEHWVRYVLLGDSLSPSSPTVS